MRVNFERMLAYAEACTGTVQAPMTHASSLAADAFAAALAAIPAEDWDRAWAADRTTCPVDRTT
jgi:hypothetical protein